MNEYILILLLSFYEVEPKQISKLETYKIVEMNLSVDDCKRIGNNIANSIKKNHQGYRVDGIMCATKEGLTNMDIVVGARDFFTERQKELKAPRENNEDMLNDRYRNRRYEI